jgi:hypothetical protein
MAKGQHSDAVLTGYIEEHDFHYYQKRQSYCYLPRRSEVPSHVKCCVSGKL